MIIDVKVPQLSESVAEATLVSWHKKAGEAVARDENLIDIETDKVVLELPAPDSGVLVEIVKGDGDTVVAGEVIARIDTAAQAGAIAAPAVKVAAGKPEAAAVSTSATASGVALPAARKILEEKGVAAAEVAGTGRGGRVTKSDALATQAPAPRFRRPRFQSLRQPPVPLRHWCRPQASWFLWATGLSSAYRCRACAPASPSACCSRRPAMPS
jgi:2-oxoglutarate dehydrogenase E2 component (dihydrolipoamide succinyltransferase)